MVPKSVLPPSWELPAEFRQRVGEKIGRQRVMFADGHLLLVLHRPPRKNDTERSGRYLWRKPDGTWQSNDLGAGPVSLTRHLAEFNDVIERYDKQEDDAKGATDFYLILDGMSPIHRTIRNLHTALQEAREAVAGDRDLINARDRAYELERRAELLVGDVRNALQFATARKAEEQVTAAHRLAVSGHQLNMLVAFFFPIAALTSIFGTNLSHPLEQYLPPPYAFLSVIGFGLILGGLLAGYLVNASPTTESK
jgi:hypothetical protein